MKKITASILTTLLMLSMVFSSSVFAANEETSAWDSFLGLFSAQASADDVGVEYRGHIQNVGDYPTDGSWIQGPERLGTVGKSLRLEAFWIKLTDAPEGLHIKYEVHVQNIGWMDPVEDGDLAGTQGDSLRIEAIKISLVDDEGNVSGDYTVTYKGHIQNVGDTAWIKSGQQLGTTGSGLRLEALEVKIEKIAPDLTDYEAALAAVTEANYTKASWAAYQDVVEDNVMTEDNVQSEVDAATAIILDAQEDLVTVPVIAGMTATAQKTITVTGTELSKLTASMFTVAGNTVTAVTPSADGKSATLTLGNDLAPETNVKVTATIDGTTKEYTVKYTVVAVTVAIQAATFDDDTANQRLTVLVDGVATTTEYLSLSGYSVNFNIWDKDGAIANTAIFGTTSNAASQNGKLAGTAPLTKGDYTAQVVIAKGSTVATSERATIKIANLNNNTDQISAYKIYKGSNAVDGTDVKLNSSTLVYGETANVGEVTIGAGTTQAILTRANTAAYAACGFTIASSDSKVISVNESTGVMTATGIGTANITITVGQATKVIPITVTGTARTVTTVTPASSSFTYVVNGTSNSVTLTVIDQYGDPMNSTFNLADLYYTGSGITGLTQTPNTSTQIATDAKGKFTMNFTLANGSDLSQTGSIVFKNKKGATIGSFSINLTNVSNVNSQQVKITGTSSSQDNTINTDTESGITFKVENYNSNGVYTGDANVQGYKVLFDKNIINVSGISYDPTINGVVLTPATTFTVVPSTDAGSTTMTVYNSDNKQIDQRTIVVSKNAPYITDVTFKSIAKIDYARTIKYTDVLDIKEAANTSLDDVINSGVTLSSTSPYTMRIVKSGTNVGKIYLDKVANSTFDSTGDILLGTLEGVVTNTSSTGWTTQSNNLQNAMTGVSVAAGAKGTLTFVVTDTVGPQQPKVVKTTGIEINVPAANNDASAVAADKAAITVGTTGGEAITAAKTNLTGLVTTGANGSTISWGSTNTTAVATNGTVTRPIFSADDAAVTITATITKGTVTDTRTFNVTVLKKNFSVTASGTDATATISPDGYALTDFAAATNVLFKASETPTSATTWVLDGLTYTLSYSSTSGVASVAVTGTKATAGTSTTTKTIQFVKDGKIVEKTLTIPTIPADTLPADVHVTIS